MLNYFCAILCKPYAVRDSADKKTLNFFKCLRTRGLIHYVLFEGIKKRAVVKPSFAVFVLYSCLRRHSTARNVATAYVLQPRGMPIRSMDKGCGRKG